MKDNEATGLERLPHWIRLEVGKMGILEPERWVNDPIPALGHRSVLEVAASDDATKVLSEYFAKVKGRF